MKLTTPHLTKFFAADHFIKFVGKKHRWFIKSEDDLAEVRFFSIRAVMRGVEKEKEFEDDKHLYGWVEKCVRNAFLSTLNDKQLNKNNLPVANESTLTYGDGDETFSLYELNAVADSPEYDNTMEYLYYIVDKVLTEDEREFFKLRLNGNSHAEIGYIMFCSGERSRTMLLRIVNKIKPYFDADNGQIRTDVQRIRKANRSEPKLVYEASSSRRGAARDFLNL